MVRKSLVIALVVCLGLIISMPAWANFSGAVYTTNSTGTLVNGNQYSAKTDVFLSGGPQPHGNGCGGVPLADGTYYFRVTNPNGQLDLSAAANDPISNRTFTVASGVWSYIGSHLKGPAPCAQAISIQLAPFNDTDNPSGVYKVWISTDQLFADSSSKTDNFKVALLDPCVGDCGTTPQSLITGEKFYDSNGNGMWIPANSVFPGGRSRPPAQRSLRKIRPSLTSLASTRSQSIRIPDCTHSGNLPSRASIGSEVGCHHSHNRNGGFRFGHQSRPELRQHLPRTADRRPDPRVLVE